MTEIYTYYEIAKEGLGLRFLASFEKRLEKIRKNPFHAFNVTKKIRKVVTQTFPYNVYFTVLENGIVIYAVLHPSGKPDTIVKRGFTG